MSEQAEELEKIEKYFHEVIEIVTLGVFPERQLPMPKLVADMIDAPKSSFHGIFSMFGGITYRILSESGKLMLKASASSRMSRFESRFEITSEGWNKTVIDHGDWEEVAVAPPQPTDEEYQANIDSLTDEELQKMDEALLSQASHQYRKAARLVGFAIGTVEKAIPDTFYAERVKKLVKEGRLIAEGDLDHMGRSEVRLPVER